MGDAATRALRVALIADHETQGKNLKELLESNGLDVILDQSIQDYDPDKVSVEQVDVLLVNLDESTSRDMEHLESLIERSTIPILFNEGGVPGGSGWGRKLISKLAGLVRAQQDMLHKSSVSPSDEWVAPNALLPETPEAEQRSRAAMQRPALRVISPGNDHRAPAQIVWVLGASLGGPQALKQFLMHLPDSLPLGLVIAQHIGKPFVPLLAEQLGRVTGLRVMPAEAGRAVCVREVVLVPVDRRFALTDAGIVELKDEPIPGPYKPCIDDVMGQVARCYAGNCGAIVFSGMGEDGALGAMAIRSAGGQVWAQDAASCVISSMPDAARRRGVVQLSGTPEELAVQLAAQNGAQVGAT